MIEWWNALPTIQQVFYILAIPSTIILVLQIILLLFGVGGDHDGDVSADADGDIDASADGDLSAQIDADGSFVPEHDAPYDPGPAHEAGLRILTVRGVVAFLAICGWVGVAALDMGAGPILSSVLAVVAGLAAMILVAVALRFSLKLQQSGNLDLKNAVGLTGEVYVPIPRGGKGKVTLTVQDRFLELDAVCSERDLSTGEAVKVTGITSSHTLLVSPLT